MADKEKKSDKSGSFFERDVDPALAERVDKLMSEEDESKPAKASKAVPSEPSGTSAPLLPTEKLPDLAKRKDQPEPEPVAETAVEAEPPTSKPEKPAEKSSAKEPHVDVNDTKTEQLVDDLEREEADRVLAIEDAKAELLADGDAVIAEGPLAGIRRFLANFWAHKSVRWLLVLVILGLIAAALVVPDSRYYLLNTAGVRGSTSMTIVDDKTRQPLKDVDVQLQNQIAKTDSEGQVSFSNMKLGNHEVLVKKPAFAATVHQLTLGWGSNPLGDISLTSIGSRYSFDIVDWLSGQPIRQAEAISRGFSSSADQKGQITLVVEDDGRSQNEIEIKAEGYRSEKIKLSVGDKEPRKLGLVSARKHAFVSKRDGKLDLFAVDADGKNLRKLLPGTGSEREDSLVLLHHPSKDQVALVSTRGNLFDRQGNLLNNLTIIDLTSGESKLIVQSATIQLLGFVGDKLIYTSEQKDAELEDPDRFLLTSYDVQTQSTNQLKQANYFNDVLVVNGTIFYSPFAGLFKIGADGTGQENLLGREAFNIFRTAYDKLHVAFADGDWYEYDLNTTQLDKLDGAPATNRSRFYEASPDDKRSVWAEERDGKGVLLLFDQANSKDKPLQTVGGLRNPIRWLDNDHVIYRVDTNSETADYVLSISGGEPKKIQDVTDTLGLGRHFY